MEITGNSYKNISRLLPVLLIYSSTIYFFSFITADPDLWGHLTFGKEIWTSKAIPRFDIYSYTAYGMKWINHEWISEVVMWLAFSTFGSPGLLIIKTVIGLVAVSAILIISGYRKSNCFLSSIVFVTAVFIISPGFMTRPQLATLLFTPLFFLLVHLYLERKINLLWMLPLIMIIWVNSHGGFLIGAGTLPVIVILEFIDCLVKKRGHGHVKTLIFWLFVTESTLLLNPYGVRLLTFLYNTVTLDRSITEWESVSLFDLSFMRLKIFSLAIITCFFINKRKNRYWEVGVIVVAMIFAFLHQRHTPILAVFAAPFLAEKLTDLLKRAGFEKKIQLSNYSKVIMALAFVSIISCQMYHTLNKYFRAGFNIVVDPNVYPTGAINFLKANDINGNVLVPFDWGEDVIWNLPESRVSIDGRFDTVYPEDVINAHFNALKSEDAWNYLLNKYPADIILAQRNPYANKLLRESKNWIYVYSDRISIIFFKNNENNKETIQRFKNKKFIYPKEGASTYFP
jgi:hypothetical protein